MDLLDNGAPEVLVLQADEASLDTTRVVLAGGGHADVFSEDGQVLVQVAAGQPDALALVRGVLRSPDMTTHGDVLDVVVVASGGWDRYVLSGDLQHRWSFTRSWDRRSAGPTVAVVNRAPFDAETNPGSPDPRRALATATSLLADAIGPPGTLHVLNLFTRRTGPDDTVTGANEDRRPDPGVVAAALEGSEAVLASWGTVPDAGLEAVDHMVDALRTRRDAGVRVLVRSHGGTIETSGRPPQPGAGRAVRSGTRLVDAPAEWLWGGQLVA